MNYTLGGSYVAPIFETVEFSFFKCKNDTTYNSCQSPAAIDKAISDATFAFVPINTYVNFENFNTPLKKFMDDRFYWYMASSLSKRVDLFIKKNYVSLQDSIFQMFGGEETHTFFDASS